jgi:hypothetical protein
MLLIHLKVGVAVRFVFLSLPMAATTLISSVHPFDSFT